MATAKPLTLRRQRADSASKSDYRSTGNLQAEVLVDTGVYHLSEPYSYLVPTDFLERVGVGSVVNVPFASSSKIGIVVKIGPVTSAGLKMISSLAHEIPIQSALLHLAEHLVKASICSPFDAFRFVLPVTSKQAIPPTSAASFFPPERRNVTNFVQSFIGESSLQLVVNRIFRDRSKKRLVLFPTSREVEAFLASSETLEADIAEFSSSAGLSARKRAYLDIYSGAKSIVVGTRSAIFAPMPEIDEIIVVDEWSEHYREQKTPYWNLRDLARARADIQRCDLFFLSSTPSLEILNLIEEGQISKTAKHRAPGISTRFAVTCSPKSYLDVVRKALKRGPVLITVAEKNFSNLFLCQKCRSVARCGCGGKIIMAKRGEFVCALCSSKSTSWRCNECHGTSYIIMRSGIEKVIEEMRKSLPNIPILRSTQDAETPNVGLDEVVVIATSGMEPNSSNGFAAVVLLDGEELAGRPFVRAEEDLLQRWMKSLQQLRKGGEVYSSLPANHRISQAIISSDPLRYLRSEFIERKKLQLPPSRTVIKIESKSESLSSLRSKLAQQFPEATIHLSRDSHSVVILQSEEYIRECTSSLRALQKVRSVQSKELFKISINPYFF